MSVSTWQETLAASQVDSAALASSTTPTSILPGAAVATLGAGFCQIGRSLRITALGRISTLVTGPGTLTLDVRFGGVIVATSPAFALNTVAQVNATWLLEWVLTCRSIGSGTSAQMMHVGKWTSRAIIGSAAVAAGGVTCSPIPDTAPALGTGFDSTATQAVNLFGTWSVNSASNSILTHQYLLEALN